MNDVDSHHSLLRPLWRVLPLGVLLTLLAAVGRVTLPFTLQRVTDSVTGATGTPSGLATLVMLVAGATAVIAAASVCGSVMGYMINHAVETVLVDLRARMLSHVHALTDLDRRTFHRGALFARLTSDVEQITGFLQRGGVYTALNAAQLLVTLGLMFFYSWMLALVIVVLLVPLAGILPVLQRKLARRFAEAQERNGVVHALASETVAGAVVVRAYGVQRRLGARLDQAVITHYNAQQRAQRLAAYAFVLGEVAVAVISAALLIGGMVLGAGGHLTLGELTAFLFLTALLIQPLQAMAENLNDLQNAVAVIGRIQSLLRLAPSIVDPADHSARTPPERPLGVELKDVGFTYPDAGRPALTGVSLPIAPGRTVAVVGETGSGKSTLLALLSRAVDPAAGQVLLGGVDLRRLRASDLRSAVHLVPQDGFLLGRTIADNVRLAVPDLDDEGVRTAFARLDLTDWLEGLPKGIDTEVGDGGRLLSAGERQLVAFARAYACDPPVLLLDEATSNLDPLTESRMANAVEAVTRGRTTIAVVHRLSTAEKADEVVLMVQGRIAARGSHTDLLARSEPYARLHAAWRRRTGLTTG